ncbi:MAG: hypothetical protein AAFN81_11145 [Bacteroidota bacterium]
MNRITVVIFLLSTVLFTLQSCASAEKLVDHGRYDEAIALAQRKLSGKQRKNPKLVRAAEEAFRKVNAREMRQLDRLKNSNDANRWGEINALTRRIRQRQEALQPLLPLTDKHGYTAQFRFANVDGLEQESREKAAAFHYAEAGRLLQQARRGDKHAARAAYRELEETQRYFRRYENANALQNEAHQLGITHILVTVANNAPVVTPNQFNRYLTNINVADLNNFWQHYHVRDNQRQGFDYEIKVRITDIAVSPELVREREYTDSKIIQDGFEYVLDERGNVAKDSLGNDITVPREVTVQAWVLETLQQKEATVEGLVEVRNLSTNRLIRSAPLTASAFFENYASTFRGDKRALSRETRQRIGNSPVPFPSNEGLILQAAEQLKPVLLDRILDYNHLVEV